MRVIRDDDERCIIYKPRCADEASPITSFNVHCQSVLRDCKLITTANLESLQILDMSQLGQVRIGHKAPDFHCEAVIGGAIKGEHMPISFLCRYC